MAKDTKKYLVINVDGTTRKVMRGYEQLSDNFQVSEFKCKDGCNVILYSKKTLEALQNLRNEIGALRLTSAFRTPYYNERVGSTDTSQHVRGTAVDITTPAGMTTEQLKDVFININGSNYGIGLYDSFLHIDTGTPRIWDERTAK